MTSVFMVVAVTIVSAAVIVAIMNTKASSIREQGTDALQIAESGAENAMLRLIRNPNYTGEVLTVGQGTATITVTGTNPKTILSVGTYASSVRKIQVIATGSAFLTVSSWQEIN